MRKIEPKVAVLVWSTGKEVDVLQWPVLKRLGYDSSFGASELVYQTFSEREQLMLLMQQAWIAVTQDGVAPLAADQALRKVQGWDELVGERIAP